MRRLVGPIIVVACVALSSGCATGKCGCRKAPVRYGSTTGLKPGKADYYKKLHAAAWPGVLKRVRDCNIRNYSIYLKEIEGKLYLFSYFEYVGDDFDADMARMAEDPETQRWWKETDPCQIPLPGAAKKGEIWEAMEEVFHAD